MSSRNDLHIHSIYSDGTDSPKEIIDKAKSFGIENIAITDHDTVAGIKEAKEYATKVGINCISGIELSTFAKYEIHILGYGIDENNSQLLENLDKFAKLRKERILKILNRLSTFNIKIDFEELPKTNSIGRLHVAKVLVSKGYVGSIKEAFDRYLGQKGCAYLPSQRIYPFDGVKLIKQAGGIPVIAHPLKYYQDRDLLDLIIGLKAYGLGGLECYYSTHDEKTTKDLLKMAQNNKLIATGGTDYHGQNKNIELGTVVWEPDFFTKKSLKLI